MSLLAIEGFDHYDDSTREGKRIWQGGTVFTSGGRYSNGGYWSADGSVTAYVEFGLGGNYQEIICGAAIYLTGVTSSVTQLFSFLAANGSVQGEIHIGSGNVLYATRGTSSILGTGTTTINTETWAYVEARYKVDDSAGEIEIYLNGVQELSLTSQDTRNVAAYNSIRSVQVKGFRYVASGRLDDLYILETGSSPNNTFLGDSRVDTLAVDANGTTNNWTPSAGSNYQNVDESPPDDGTTYNEADADGEIDLFGHVDLAQTTSVFGVQVSARLTKTDASALFARLGVRSGGTNYWGTVDGVGSDYSFVTELFEENPATSTAWTRTTVNAAEIGVQRVAVATTPPPTTLTTSAPTTAAPTTAAPTTL